MSLGGGDILGLPPPVWNTATDRGLAATSVARGGGGGARNENHSGSGFWSWRTALCNTQAIISAPQWNFSARILAQLAELDPHMHFSPKSTFTSCPRCKIRRRTASSTDEYERGAHVTSMRQMPTC